ncbi:MAG: hypothetical protein ACFE9D_12210 [Promethearchaeota archaeon]
MNLSLQGQIHWYFLLLLLLGSLSCLAGIAAAPVGSSIQSNENPREGWAVLMEMNFYSSGNDLDTGYADSQKWNLTLQTLGWQTHHILIHQGEITQQAGEAALHFLAMNADANDIVLFFVFAHGNYLLSDAYWNTWFPQQWMNLESQEKLFVVASCTSELLLNPLYDDPSPHIHIASTEADEYGWAGSPEEGLPIIGEVFTHFFTNALINGSADSNTDGEVTVEEAFAFAAPLSRNYITTVVFPAFPYFAEMCDNTAPHPVLDDSYLGNLSLQVDLGDPPLTPSGILPELGLLIGGVLIIIVVFVLAFYVWRRR